MIQVLFLIIFFPLIPFIFFLNNQPFQLSDDMVTVKNYNKKLLVNEKDVYYGSTLYTQKTKQLLADTNKETLIGIRCSDSFLRNDQGVYILENMKANFKNTRRLKNKEFIEFMRNKERELPKGKKILTARICETEDKTLLLFYSIGKYDIKTVNSTSIRKTILYSTKNNAFVQIIPKAPFAPPQIFEIAQSEAHIRCDKPFQFNKTYHLTVLCTEEENWISTFFVNQINLQNGKTFILEKCVNTFKERLIHTDCN